MSASGETPTRLVNAGGGDPLERRAAELLRALQAPPPRLPPSARARIVARLDERPGRAAPDRLARGRRGGVHPLRGRRRGRRLGPRAHAAVARPVAEPTRRRARRPRGPRPDAARRRARARAGGPRGRAARRGPPPAPGARRARARGAAAAPSEDPVVAESRLLAGALQDLRQHRDPQAALRALDEYERRFPAGALAPEAAAARIDALLALGRRAQALARLESLSLDHLPRGAELRALRGELRAGRGELGGALDDFSAVLANTAAPAGVVERALYGRGSCRSRLGDVAGARADLNEVLRRFPNGPFAEAGPARAP